MYNTDLPRRADLPTSAQLKRSSWIASITAAGILAFVVLPSEYGVDPTGIGGILGLTQMGQIKMQLAEEAALDAAAASTPPVASASPAIVERLDRIENMLAQFSTVIPAMDGFSPPAAQDPAEPADVIAAPTVPTPQDLQARLAPPAEEPVDAASGWTDEVSFTLAPGEGAEFKLVMQEGARADFHWTANGSAVNYDTHGDGGGNSISYEKGRSVPEQEGTLEAAFSGNHGWFWRNRTDTPLTMTLRTRGAYSELKQVI